jgi:hypothetical protein
MILCENLESLKYCSPTVIDFVRTIGAKFDYNESSLNYFGMRTFKTTSFWTKDSVPVMIKSLKWNADMDVSLTTHKLQMTDYGVVRIVYKEDDRLITVFSHKLTVKDSRMNKEEKVKSEEFLDYWMSSHQCPLDIAVSEVLKPANYSWSIEALYNRMCNRSIIPRVKTDNSMNDFCDKSSSADSVV